MEKTVFVVEALCEDDFDNSDGCFIGSAKPESDCEIGVQTQVGVGKNHFGKR